MDSVDLDRARAGETLLLPQERRRAQTAQGATLSVVLIRQSASSRLRVLALIYAFTFFMAGLFPLLLKDVTSMTLKGTLNYQACDEKVCFSPRSVPLTWTVAVRQLDRERVKR